MKFIKFISLSALITHEFFVKTDNYVPFPLYWHAMLDHFAGKVPAKTIGNILWRLIAALKLCNGNNDYDVITSKIDFDGILTAEHFLAPKNIVAQIFNESELRGDIAFIVKKIDVPTNAQLPYMSPEQVIVSVAKTKSIMSEAKPFDRKSKLKFERDLLDHVHFGTNPVSFRSH